MQLTFLTVVGIATFVAVFAIASIVSDLRTARVALRRKLEEIAELDGSGSAERWTVRRR